MVSVHKKLMIPLASLMASSLAKPIKPGQCPVLGSSSAVVCVKMCRWVDALFAMVVYYSRCYVAKLWVGEHTFLLLPHRRKVEGDGDR